MVTATDPRATWRRVTYRALWHDKWVAVTWATLLAAAVYASATATPWLYPTAAQRTSAAEAINASPGIVALYGPILDTHSLGELAMTKMTVLYSIFVTVMCASVVRRRARAAGTPDQSRPASLRLGMSEAAVLSALVGLIAAVANIAAGLPPGGSLAFGASWAGIGLVATTLTALICQFDASARTTRALTVAAILVLFAVRAIGDGLSVTWLSWLSPFGWSTRLEAWSTPRWWVLALYAIASMVLAALALGASGKRADRAAALDSDVGPALHPHRAWSALAVWTVTAGALAAYFGAISSDIGALLQSANARTMIERLGGTGPLSDVLTGAEFSIVAAVVTAYGIMVINWVAVDGRSDAVGQAGRERRATFVSTVSAALAGTTWLLLVTGAMFTAGTLATGGPATARYIQASLNHAPAVWTIVAMAAVAWTLVPVWSQAGWALLALFTAIGPIGRLLGLPQWLVDFSPYTRISLMPAERFDWVSTVALTVGALVLLAIAAYDYTRSFFQGNSKHRREGWTHA